MIFVDSNIPMYLIGAPHPNKARAGAAIERLLLERERLITDAEVLQEILHRYTALKARDQIQRAVDCLSGLVDTVLDVNRSIVLAAKDLVLSYSWLSARDAVHVAAMRAYGVTTILTFDHDFRRVPGIDAIDA